MAALLVSASGFHHGNLAIVPFDEGYTQLFGDNNLVIHKDGNAVHLSLDERTGWGFVSFFAFFLCRPSVCVIVSKRNSNFLIFFCFFPFVAGSGFVSQDLYAHGYFSASIKLPADYTAGVVVAFYMSNGDTYEKNHDEIDFEFLGNIRGKDWRIQTNIYGNGSTSSGREERFYVDDVPIREVVRTASMGGDFPSKPMSLYATIWDGSTWATNGGKYKVNYNYAPYTSEFSDFVLHGCAVDPTEHTSSHCDTTYEALSKSEFISTPQRTKMDRFRTKYMTYSYCYDRIRYNVPLPECVINPLEAQRLKSFDPVTFGGGRARRHGRRHRRNRPAAVHGEAISM
ncbi:Probable xyloglucan endotransglucosylase/hydrolase protein 28 [Linum perenne]